VRISGPAGGRISRGFRLGARMLHCRRLLMSTWITSHQSPVPSLRRRSAGQTQLSRLCMIASRRGFEDRRISAVAGRLRTSWPSTPLRTRSILDGDLAPMEDIVSGQTGFTRRHGLAVGGSSEEGGVHALHDPSRNHGLVEVVSHRAGPTHACRRRERRALLLATWAGAHGDGLEDP
jgi:hypothetical protein